jgi:Zn-dependent protease
MPQEPYRMSVHDRTSAGTTRADRRISPVFWVLLAVAATSAWSVWTGYGNARFGVFLFVVSGWVVSLCLHEYAHARTALHGGDITIGAKGYLTLNPFRYTHVVLSILLPVLFVLMGGIGLPGGAVFIERGRIRGRWRHSLISAAGPLTNLLCAAALLIPFAAGWLDSNPLLDASSPHGIFAAAFAFLALLQVSAAILNLLPVPGLDGYGIIEPWLSPAVRRQVEPYQAFGLILVFALLWQPTVNGWFFDLVDGVLGLSGMASWLPSWGHNLFQFWKDSAF